MVIWFTHMSFGSVAVRLFTLKCGGLSHRRQQSALPMFHSYPSQNNTFMQEAKTRKEITSQHHFTQGWKAKNLERVTNKKARREERDRQWERQQITTGHLPCFLSAHKHPTSLAFSIIRRLALRGDAAVRLWLCDVVMLPFFPSSGSLQTYYGGINPQKIGEKRFVWIRLAFVWQPSLFMLHHLDSCPLPLVYVKNKNV